MVEHTKRAEAEARLGPGRAALNGADGARAVSKVLQSPLVQSLREQQAEVERQAAELTQDGDRHPELINIHADAEDLRQKVTEEVDRIGQGLRNDVSVARAREGTLETALDRLRDEVGQADADEVTLRGCYERVLGDMFDGNWRLDRGEVGPEWVTIYYERREIGRFPTLAEFHHPLFVLADLGLQQEKTRERSTTLPICRSITSVSGSARSGLPTWLALLMSRLF